MDKKSAGADIVDDGDRSPTDERMALLEINISNTNANSQIVLNDLRLLELLCKYPFLYSKHVSQQDVDYDDWGWQQVATAFNESYKGLTLSTPFSMAELRWRWEILRPLINALTRAKGQIPEAMWKIVVHIKKRLHAEKPKETWNSSCQDLVLSQLPFVDGLSHSLRLRLEAQVLDLIMDEERRTKYIYDEMNSKTKRLVQSECDEFFTSIKVKELPPDTLKRLRVDNGFSFSFSFSSSRAPTIINANETGLVISNVFSSAEGVANGTNVPEIKIEPFDDESASDDFFNSPMTVQQVNSPLRRSKYQTATVGAAKLNVIVPLKEAKEFCKNLRVRLKRLDLDDYMPLASIRRSSRFAAKS